MARILISPIGVGQSGEKSLGRQYKMTNYKLENYDETYNTPFISEALSEYFKIDKIFYVGTSKSMWEDLYEYFSKKNNTEIDEEYWYELGNNAIDYKYNDDKTEISKLDKLIKVIDINLKNINLNATGGSLPVIILYGLNQNELWQNFSTFMGILDKVNDEDEIYIDITHSFRSIPIFMYLILEFIETLKYKNIRIIGMYYGMFEANAELNYTPIVNLKPLLEISKWIRGTHDFINFGNGYVISNLINSDDNNLDYNKKLSHSIENISDLVNINYLIELREEINKIDGLLYSSLGKDSGVLAHVLPLMRTFIERFTKLKNDSDFQLELCRWYFENKRYGHGYICFVEAILTKLCEVYKLSVNDLEVRNGIKSVLNLGYRYRHIKDLEALSKLYYFANPVRNKIAHASFIRGGEKQLYKENIKIVNSKLKEAERLFKCEAINELDKKIPYEVIKNNYNNWEKRKSKKFKGGK